MCSGNSTGPTAGVRCTLSSLVAAQGGSRTARRWRSRCTSPQQLPAPPGDQEVNKKSTIFDNLILFTVYTSCMFCLTKLNQILKSYDDTDKQTMRKLIVSTLIIRKHTVTLLSNEEAYSFHSYNKETHSLLAKE